MKHRKFPKPFFLLLSFIFLWNCQKDDNISNAESKNNLTVSKISFELFSKDDEAVKIINKINKTDTSNKRIIYSSEFDFYVNTDEVFFIEDNTSGYHSYSFNIIRNNPADNNIECLLLSLNSENEYDTYIVKYDFTSEEYDNLTEDELENHQVIFTKIDFDLSEHNIVGRGDMPGWTCDEVWSLIEVTQPTITEKLGGRETYMKLLINGWFLTRIVVLRQEEVMVAEARLAEVQVVHQEGLEGVQVVEVQEDIMVICPLLLLRLSAIIVMYRQ